MSILKKVIVGAFAVAAAVSAPAVMAAEGTTEVDLTPLTSAISLQPLWLVCMPFTLALSMCCVWFVPLN